MPTPLLLSTQRSWRLPPASGTAECSTSRSPVAASTCPLLAHLSAPLDGCEVLDAVRESQSLALLKTVRDTRGTHRPLARNTPHITSVRNGRSHP